jgi:hypothetical protein
LAQGQQLILDQANDLTDNGGIFLCDARTWGQSGNTQPCTVNDVNNGNGDNNDGRPITISSKSYTMSQKQVTMIQTVSGSGTGPYTVVISPGVYFNNIRSGTQPGAWWPGTLKNVGLENVYLDGTAVTNDIIQIAGCYQCWVKGVATYNADRSHVMINVSSHTVIRDNYFFQSRAHASQSYGVEPEQSSADLIENNICQQLTNCIMTGNTSGSVYGYNFSVGGVYTNPNYLQDMSYPSHNAGNDMNLYEGNNFTNSNTDDTWGSSNTETFFRNFQTGWQHNFAAIASFTGSSGTLTFTTVGQDMTNVSGQSVALYGFSGVNTNLNGQTVTVGSPSGNTFQGTVTGSNYASGPGSASLNIYYNTIPWRDASFSRVHNIVGNVFGQPGYHNNYESYADSTSCPGVNCPYQSSLSTSIYGLGYTGAGESSQGTCGLGVTSAGCDPVVRSTLMRWGNYDTVNAATRWNSNEAAPAAVAYVNANFTSSYFSTMAHTLPASLYYSSTPSWWSSGKNWPPVGPDVTTGNVGICTGGTYPGAQATAASQCTGGTLTAAWASHVTSLPAQDCYLNVMGGVPDGTGSVLSFDANQCYYSGSTTSATNIDDTLTAWGGYGTAGWKPVCVLPGCNPGGVNPPSATNQTINNASPSLDGESMLLSITSPAGGNSNSLWTYIAGANEAATQFVEDYRIYPSANVASTNALEDDDFLFSTTLNTEFMFGHNCVTGGYWQVWNQLTGAWVNTSVACSLPATTWTHVQWTGHRVAGDTSACSGHPCMYYDTLTINGTPNAINMTEPAGTLPGGWASAVGIQWQIDVSAGNTTVTENLDEASFQASTNAPGGNLSFFQSSGYFVSSGGGYFSLSSVPAATNGTLRGGSLAPPNFGGVRIDTDPIVVGTIPNVWSTGSGTNVDYGFTGAGSITTGTTGLPMCRVTDGCTDSGGGCTTGNIGKSFANNYSGGDTDQHWSIDHSQFTVAENAAANTYIGWMTENTHTITGCGMIKNSGNLFYLPGKAVAADQDVAKIWYVVSGTAIYKYDLSACTTPFTTCAPSPTLIYDFGATNHCLAGISPTWTGVFSASHNIGGLIQFQWPLSASGGQNLGTIQAVYSYNPTSPGSSPGCRVWNTGTTPLDFSAHGGYGPTQLPPGSVYGDWGANGQVNMIGSNYSPLSSPISSVVCNWPYCQVYTTLYPPANYNIVIYGSSVSQNNGTWTIQYTGTQGFAVLSYTGMAACASNCGTVALTGDLFTIHDPFVSEGNQWIIESGEFWSAADGTGCSYSESNTTVTATGCSAWPQAGYGVTIKACTPYTNQNYTVQTASNTSFTFTAKAGIGSASGCSWSYNAVEAADQPYFWDIPTTNVIVSKGLVGHGAGGYDNYAHGTNNPQGMFAYIDLYDSYTWSKSVNNNWNLVPTVAPSNSATLDSHCSWSNADVNDTYPILCSTSNEVGAAAPSPSPANTENDGCVHVYPYPVTATPTCGTANPFSGPYVQEMLYEPTSDVQDGNGAQCSASTLYTTAIGGKNYYSCSPPLGSCTTLANCQTFWRLGNSGSTVISWNFNSANGTIDLSPDMLAWSWTSDWFGWLGTTDHATVAGMANGQVLFVSGTTYQVTSNLNPPVNQLVTISTATGNTSLNGNWVVTATNASWYKISSAVSLACASNCGKTNIQPIVGGLNWIKAHVYNTGDVITPQAGNTSNYTYQASAPCTSGSAAPTWAAGTANDGGCTWTYIGMQNLRGDLFVGYIPQS